MIFAVLFALVLLVYFPAIYATPIWDDQQLFLDVDLPKWAWKNSKGARRWHDERWLTQASFGLTFRYAQRWTEDRRHTFTVAMLHTTNILLHFINSLLFYGMVSVLVEPVRATLAALIFVVHPLAPSAVAPIVSRSSVMSTTFIIGASWLALTGHPFLALTMAVGAFWSKEDGVAAFPLVIALTALTSPWMALVQAVMVVAVIGRMWQRLWALGYKLYINSGATTMANAGLNTQLQQPAYTATAVIENLKRWPGWLFGFGLNADPDTTKRSLFHGLLAFITAAFFAGMVLFHGERSSQAAILILFLSPWTASWLFPLPDPVSELRAYSTVIPAAIFLSAAPIVLAVPLVVWLGGVAAHRAWLQQNEIRLWRWSWDEGSRKVRVAVNIGAAYTRNQKMKEAFEWHQVTSELFPDNGILLINLALFYESCCRAERGVIGNQFVVTGRVNPEEQAKRTQEAAKALATAIVYARKAMASAPKDPWVRQYAGVIEKHAKSLGVEVVEEA